jgi:hypothetical protein
MYRALLGSLETKSGSLALEYTGALLSALEPYDLQWWAHKVAV